MTKTDDAAALPQRTPSPIPDGALVRETDPDLIRRVAAGLRTLRCTRSCTESVCPDCQFTKENDHAHVDYRRCRADR